MLVGWLDAAVWRSFDDGDLLPEVAEAQRAAASALRTAQAAVSRLVIVGIGEAIGVVAFPSVDGAGVSLALPVEGHAETVVQALLAENVTAYLSEDAGRTWATVGVAPWYRADEIDHVVLCVAKVIHVIFGIHPSSMDEQAHAGCAWHGSGVLPSVDDRGP
jgi:hypothetical protein